MAVMKGIYTKHEDLIRRLGVHAPCEPYDSTARHYFFEGAKVALEGHVDSEEIEYIIEGANSVADDILEVFYDFED